MLNTKQNSFIAEEKAARILNVFRDREYTVNDIRKIEDRVDRIFLSQNEEYRKKELSKLTEKELFEMFIVTKMRIDKAKTPNKENREERPKYEYEHR